MQGLSPAANGEGLGRPPTPPRRAAEKLAGKVLGCEGGLPGWARGEAEEAAEGLGPPGALSDAPAPSPVSSSRAPGSPSTRAAGI